MADPAPKPTAPPSSGGALVPAVPPHPSSPPPQGSGGATPPVTHLRVMAHGGGMDAVSPVFARFVLVLGLLGCLIGILMSTWNQDQIGWALLRTAGLGVVFAWAGRYMAGLLMRAWLETRVETLEKELAAEIAAEAGMMPENAGANPAQGPVDKVAAAKPATPAPGPGAKAK